MPADTPAATVPATRQRMVWMDALRGLAIVLIVLLHATEIVRAADIPVSRAFLYFNAFMSPFRIPLLMVLSGMLLGGSLRKGTGRYLTGKLRAIVWPYAVWSVLLVLAFPFLGVDSLVRALWAPGTYLWYLHTLFICYLVALAFRRVSPSAAAVLALVAAITVFHLPLAETVELMRPVRTLEMLACFFAGHWIMQNRDVVLRATRRWWVTALLALVGVGLGLLALAPGVSVSNNPWFVVPLLATICAGIGIVQRFSWTSWPAAWIRWVGRHSIIYYVTHWFALDYSLRLWRELPEWRGFVAISLMVATALAVGALLALAQRYIPPVRWLFRI